MNFEFFEMFYHVSVEKYAARTSHLRGEKREKLKQTNNKQSLWDYKISKG